MSNQGWIKQRNWKKYHYFIDRESLCGKHVVSNLAWGSKSIFPVSDRCSICLKKLMMF